MLKLDKDKIEAMKNPTLEAALRYWPYDILGPPLTPDIALAGLHKAVILWPGSTTEMIMKSRIWLEQHGWEVPKTDIIARQRVSQYRSRKDIQ